MQQFTSAEYQIIFSAQVLLILKWPAFKSTRECSHNKQKHFHHSNKYPEKNLQKHSQTYRKTQAEGVMWAGNLPPCQRPQARLSPGWPSSKANITSDHYERPHIAVPSSLQKSSQPVSRVLCFYLLGYWIWQTYTLCVLNNKVFVILPKGAFYFKDSPKFQLLSSPAFSVLKPLTCFFKSVFVLFAFLHQDFWFQGHKVHL